MRLGRALTFAQRHKDANPSALCPRELHTDNGRTYDAARRREPQQNRVRGEDDGDEVLGLAVDGLEVDLLAAGAGEHRAELEPDEEPAEGEDEAEDPEHERRAHGPDGSQDRGGRREDAGADDAHDAVGRGGLVVFVSGRIGGVCFARVSGAVRPAWGITRSASIWCIRFEEPQELKQDAEVDDWDNCGTYMSSVQLNTPRWRPIPPAVSVPPNISHRTHGKCQHTHLPQK